MSDESLEQELERLRAENASLKGKLDGERAGNLTLKISEKGALSIYGLGRFPVTLYKEQWLKLLAIKDQIQEFIEKNSEKLKTKS